MSKKNKNRRLSRKNSIKMVLRKAQTPQKKAVASLLIHKLADNAITGELARVQWSLPKNSTKRIDLVSTYHARNSESSYYLLGRSNTFSILRVSDHEQKVPTKVESIVFDPQRINYARQSKITSFLIPQITDWVDDKLSTRLDAALSYWQYVNLLIMANLSRDEFTLLYGFTANDKPYAADNPITHVGYAHVDNRNYTPVPDNITKLHTNVSIQKLIDLGLAHLYPLDDEVHANTVGLSIPKVTYDLLIYNKLNFSDTLAKDTEQNNKIYPHDLLVRAWNNAAVDPTLLPPLTKAVSNTTVTTQQQVNKAKETNQKIVNTVPALRTKPYDSMCVFRNVHPSHKMFYRRNSEMTANLLNYLSTKPISQYVTNNNYGEVLFIPSTVDLSLLPTNDKGQILADKIPDNISAYVLLEQHTSNDDLKRMMIEHGQNVSISSLPVLPKGPYQLFTCTQFVPSIYADGIPQQLQELLKA